MSIFKLKNKKEIIAWSFYDFANQPFTTIIVTFVYSAYFVKEIAPNESLGTQMWSIALTITAIVVAFLSPIFGVIADKVGVRKLLLLIFTIVCSVSTILLPINENVFSALILFIIANISFELCSVFYNSYLPEISNVNNSGRISGFAWGLGFFGGLLALLLVYNFFDFNNSLFIRKTNIFIGLWFLIFSIPTFKLLRDDPKDNNYSFFSVKNTFISIRETFYSISEYKIILHFLIARLFYNDGLITIFGLGGIYAVTTLDFTFNEVVKLAIILNIAAGVGSFIFGYIEDRIGFKKVINISLIVLILATLIAYIAPETQFPKKLFWLAGVLIGLMTGPNQSSSRSLMAKLIPTNKKSEFFGFYSLTGKATSFLGPLFFGIVTLYYNQQVALWIVIILFLIGFILFNRINFNFLNLQDES